MAHATTAHTIAMTATSDRNHNCHDGYHHDHCFAIKTQINMSTMLAAIATMIARAILFVTTRIADTVEVTAIKNLVIILN